ncbi:multidrug effflux MFS transporter [Vibrio palustris]|uniref:Bcr/CflA family efflux transporter n=1 Tax=Vibrio palustris TaxID=1918946 RepID=A0A1R4B5P0_9VIBR|nr:multidrug effflux MFS transporter [Vibrio palustris]SJL84196.1 Bicyclomycin resistance protein [Vibrio palustris]
MNDKLTRPLFLAILCTLMAFASLSIDLYLPAMPLMAKELHGDVELTVTAFLVGFSIAQLIWGPISDSFGRRLPLYIGMLMFIVGSAGCALSKNMEQIVLWRIVQAFGACTGPMLARAMIRDSFSRVKAAQMFSTLFFFMAVAPIVGPLIGGQIIRFSSWRVIFVTLAALGVIMFISLFALPETLHEDKRVKLSFANAFNHYLVLVKNRIFMKYTLCLTFFYVAAYAYMTGSPFVYISYFGVAPQYFGFLFGLNLLGVMAMSILNRRLVLRYSLKQLLKIAVFVSLLAAVILALVVKIQIGGVVAVVLSIFLFFSMNGIIAANTTTAALDAAPSLAGSASATIGALQYGSGIVSTLLLAYFKDGTPWPMAWIMLVFTLASIVTLLWPNNTVKSGD